MSTYRALLTRELIEHRVAFVTTPLVIAGVILLATTALLISFNVGVIRVEDLEIRSFGDLLGHMADAVERGNHMLAPQVLAILSVPLFLLSLAAVLVQTYHAFVVAGALGVLGAGAAVLPALVIAIGVGLIWYARSAKEKGWLK